MKCIHLDRTVFEELRTLSVNEIPKVQSQRTSRLSFLEETFMSVVNGGSTLFGFFGFDPTMRTQLDSSKTRTVWFIV